MWLQLLLGLVKRSKQATERDCGCKEGECVFLKRFDELKANFKKMIVNICESPKPKPRPKVTPKPPGLHSRYLIYLHSSSKSKYVFNKSITVLISTVLIVMLIIMYNKIK